MDSGFVKLNALLLLFLQVVVEVLEIVVEVVVEVLEVVVEVSEVDGEHLVGVEDEV